MYNYLTHEDNPEKAQYSKADIETINGFDIREFVEMSKSEVNRYIREITEFVVDNGIMEYADLMEVTLRGGEGMADWFDVAANHTLYFTSLIKSCRYRAERKEPNPLKVTRDAPGDSR